jgi:hypothetical protein
MDSMVILRTTGVIRLTGLSHTTVCCFERSGGFPARLRWASFHPENTREARHDG